jgi:hypothetical protein
MEGNRRWEDLSTDPTRAAKIPTQATQKMPPRRHHPLLLFFSFDENPLLVLPDGHVRHPPEQVGVGLVVLATKHLHVWEQQSCIKISDQQSTE